MRNFAFEGTAFLNSGLFAGTENLPFASRRARKPFYGESGCLEHSSHYPFGAVRGEDTAGIHLPVQVVEEGLTPHFRLFFGCKGIEIDHIVVRLKIEVREISFYFVQREVGREADGTVPGSSMQGIELFAGFRGDYLRISQFPYDVFSQRVPLNAGETDFSLLLFGFQ